MCFPVNFAKFLRTPFLTGQLRWLLLEGEVSFKARYNDATGAWLTGLERRLTISKAIHVATWT